MQLREKYWVEASNSADIITPTNVIYSPSPLPSPTIVYSPTKIVPTNMPKTGNFDYLTILSSIAFILVGVGIILVF
ncbi:MAG: hypothetical protein KatS3mg092_0902 [Patescibacteria group bacterium]|nr:MAG: hypothetical protein KatS3mg092_0902 [Patescibacteria group bacterium]